MRELLRHRDARLVVGGQAVSAFGDWLLMLVFGIWVKDLTGSNGAAGAVILAMSAPTLLAPLAGLLVDRVSRRGLLVVNDLAAAAALVPLLFVHDASHVWVVFVVAALYGLSAVVLNSGVTALVQERLDGDLLAQANGTIAAVRQGMRLVGPLIGASLYATGGIPTLVALDAGTFIVSAAAFARTGSRPSATDGRPLATEGLLAEVTAGLRFARRDPVLAPTLVAAVLAFSCIGFLEPAIFALAEAFDKPAAFVGVTASIQGAGAVLGGLCAAPLLRRVGAARGFQVGLLGIAVVLGGLALPWLPAVLVAAFGGGVVVSFLLVSLTTLQQQRTPTAVIGRVAALTNLALTLPSMVSVAVGSALIDRIGYLPLIVASAIACAAGGLLAVLTVPHAPADRQHVLTVSQPSAYADTHDDAGG